MKFLTVDIGTGTQDIFLYDSNLDLENGFKLVLPSPTMMGWVADHRSLQLSFVLPVIAMALSSAILFYGMRFAPPLRVDGETAQKPAPSEVSS